MGECCYRISGASKWAELAHLRGTAAALLCVEPTRPDPHARWCGEGERKRAPLPDLFGFHSIKGFADHVPVHVGKSNGDPSTHLRCECIFHVPVSRVPVSTMSPT